MANVINVFCLQLKRIYMTKLKIILTIASVAAFFLTACSDSTSASNGPKYLLDEERQEFGIIYDRCYVTENSTRWEEYVDTSYFYYKFVDDYLVIFKGHNTSDKTDGDSKNKDEFAIMEGGKAGEIYGTWKETEKFCSYSDGSIDCASKKEKGERTALLYLKVTSSSLSFSVKMEGKYCMAERFIDNEFIEGLLEDNFDMDTKDLSISRSDCNTAKFKIDGKSVTATGSLEVGKDNVMTTKVTFTSDNKTCSYTEKRVIDEIQYPESVCNVDDMSKYTTKKPNRYVIEYDNDIDFKKKFLPCVAEMLDVEY